jgi:hypothetical protein
VESARTGAPLAVIVLHKGTNGTLSLSGPGAAPAPSPGVNDSVTVDALELEWAGGGKAKITFQNSFPVPVLFLDPSDRSTLLDRQKLDDLIKTRKDVADKLRALRDQLRRDVSGIAIAVDGAGGAKAFFGVTSIAGVPFAGSGAAAIATASLEVAALLAEGADGLSSSAALRLRAAASAKVTLQVLNQQREIDWRLVVTATVIGDVTFNIVPEVEIPRLAIPLDLRFLDGLLPNSLDGFALPDIDRLLDLTLPLPANLQLDWTTKPQFALAVAGGDLTVKTTTAGQGSLKTAAGSSLIEIAGFALTFDNKNVTLAGKLTAAGSAVIDVPVVPPAIPDGFPLVIAVSPPQLSLKVKADIDLAHANPQLNLIATLTVDRLNISARRNPSVVIALTFSYEVIIDTATGGPGKATLKTLTILAPTPLDLVQEVASDAFEGLVRLVGLIPNPTLGDAVNPDLKAMLDRLAALLSEMIGALVDAAGTAASALVGVAEAAAGALGKILEYLQKFGGGAASYVAIEVRLDSRTLALRQIIVSPVNPPNGSQAINANGIELEIDAAIAPALLIDLTGRPLIALTLQKAAATATLSTDLWLTHGDGRTEAVRDTDAETGQRPKDRLLAITATSNNTADLVLIALQGGHPTFFRTLEGQGTPTGIRIGTTPIAVRPIPNKVTLGDINWDADVRITVSANSKRLLPFLSTPSASGDAPNFADKLSQYVKVLSANDPTMDRGTAKIPLKVEIHLPGLGNTSNPIETTLDLKLDLTTLGIKIEAQNIAIRGKRTTLDILGLDAVVAPATGANVDADGTFDQFVLDFSTGEPRMALSDQARVDLSYSKIASGGRGIVFKVESFAVAKGVFDVEAKVDPETPVQLAGVEQQFHFTEGGISIKRGKLQTFSIAGHGPLPPALVGEADAKVRIAFATNANGGIIVQSATAELTLTQPLVCHATYFTLTISELGLDFRDFGADGGYQFYFLLTGSAEFTPDQGSALASGLLKYLSSLKIVLNKAPLAGDSRVLARAIEFHVAVEPKKTVNFFEIFTFELRGVGFHPRVAFFDDKPALSISGQVDFGLGDKRSGSIRFHELWIAPPKDKGGLPQVRFDGLGVGLNIGMATVEGTAIAVDGSLPSLYAPDVLPANIGAHGFLASGRLSIQGWASMAAAMGFLELENKQTHQVRPAFFIYGEMDELSVTIPTPIGDLYVREFGFGFGFRYTLAALAAADRVTNPKMLVAVLDSVSKYQGNLGDFKAWEPEAEGDRLTLALRAMISLSSANPDEFGLVDEEQYLENPLLFDIVAALRSDLTFLMNVRAWIAVNYWTWVNKGRREFSDRPLLRGYLYISVPRQEFLARMIADPTGYIGDTPKLPEPLQQALQSVHWSSTLYIRPGLFHAEYGWPYELSYDFSRGDSLYINCSGGMITRIEDFSLLFGLAFRANGHAQLGGSIGGSSLGASVYARADFQISAKFIAYLSLKSSGDTLFYGSLDFSVTVAFQVRIWLEFSVWRATIHLEVSFSTSLTVTLAIEVAAGVGMLAGRGAATVSVSAFGRTLGLSAGFGFHEGDLVGARARVERFLALGLAASVPDPAKGLEPPPAQTHNDASKVIDDQASQIEKSMPEVPPLLAPDAPHPDIKDGKAIGIPRFWAFLFPMSRQGHYVLQLIPRDRTTFAQKRESAQPQIVQDDGEPFELGDNDGTFYAPPPIQHIDPPDYLVWLGKKPDGFELWQIGLDGDMSSTPLSIDATDPTHGITLKANRAAIVAKDSGRTLNFAELCGDFFVAEWIDNKLTGNLFQPDADKVYSNRIQLSADRDERARLLREAGMDQTRLSPMRAAGRDVEQRRSAAISTIADGTARLASTAIYDASLDNWQWPQRFAPIDPRDFGLTFFFKGDDAGVTKLFGSIDGDPEVPPLSWLNVATRIKDDEAWPKDTNLKEATTRPRLFNFPSRFFARATPRLANPGGWIADGKVHLDWDLEPGWGHSASVWGDPEFHVKHYRIERIVMNDEGPIAKWNLAGEPPVTTKAAAPLKLVPYDDGLAWQHIRPHAQYCDDLARLPDRFRNAVLDLDTHAWDDWTVVREDGGNNPRIVYIVVPVDASGSEGLGTPITVPLTQANAPRVAIAKAELLIRYDGIGEVGSDVHRPELLLAVSDALFIDKDAEPDKAQKNPDNGIKYLLKVRAERGYPAGLYGADALTDAKKRPTASDFERDEPGDSVFQLTAVYNPAPALNPEVTVGAIKTKDTAKFFFKLEAWPSSQVISAPLKALLDALGIDNLNKVRPVRLALQRQPVGKSGDAHYSPVGSPWCAVDTILAITKAESDPNGKDRPYPVDATVEVFEHPRNAKFEPLAFGDLDGEAGRILLTVPELGATLGDLAEGRNRQVRLISDPQRRIGTRVRWNARPSCDSRPKAALSPHENADLIGGFDLFEIDMAEVADPAAGVGRFVRRVARVQELPPALAGSDFGHIEDYAGIEAHYPSETARIKSRGSAATNASGDDADHSEVQSAWFSTGESLPRMPARILRRSLAIDYEQALIPALFAVGAPATITIELKKFPSSPDISKWPTDKTWQQPIVKRTDQDAPSTAGSFPGPPDPKGKPRWTAAGVGELLRKLVWHPREAPGSAAEAQSNIDEAFRKHPESFAGISLSLTGIRADGKKTGTIELKVTVGSALHPVLADVLDLIRWKKGSDYRRYSVVLDGAPQTKATAITAFLDERPPERDPYGWAVLRTLGLAVGFRLYDAETATFVNPVETAALLSGVMEDIVARYASAEIGAPLVELLTRANGLMRMASFDEANPQSTDAQTLIRNGGHALVQASLRPFPDSIVPPHGLDARPVRYFLAVANKHPSFVIKPSGLPLDMLIEVIDLSGGIAGGKIDLLAHAGYNPVTFKKWLDGNATAVQTVDWSGLTKVLLRVTADRNGSWASSLQEAMPDASVIERNVPLAFKDDASNTSDPFERFGALPPARIAWFIAHAAQATGFQDTFNAFRDLAGRRFADGWPPIPASAGEDASLFDGFKSFVARLASWLERFLVHGPASGPEVNAAKTPFALATLMMPDPLRVPPAVDGTIDLVLLHKTRFSLRRRYVVQPYGRYESFVTGFAAATADAKNPTQAFAPSQLLEIPGDLAYTGYSVDITVPRTEPLTAPVFVSARRLDLASNARVDDLKKIPADPKAIFPRWPGHALEFVLSRHEEELQTEANATIADGLQFEHVAIGFWREFSARPWADALKIGREAQLDGLEYAPAALDARGKVPALSFPNALSFARDVDVASEEEGDEMWRHSSLPDRIADGWRGITAVRTFGTPHFYRLHAVAFAAAGVVVSPPSAAAIPEGYYENHMPWDKPPTESPRPLDDGGDDLNGPPADADAETPVWWTARNLSYNVDLDEISGSEDVWFGFPLSRFIEGMPYEERDIWLPGGKVDADDKTQRVFFLPDPSVSYAIEIRAELGGGSTSSEIELAPAPVSGTAAAAFLASAAGSRFSLAVADPKNPKPINIPPDLKTNSDRDWRLRVDARAASNKPKPELDTRIPSSRATDRELAKHYEPEKWTGWAVVVPVASRGAFTFYKPPGAPGHVNWAPFNADVETWFKAFTNLEHVANSQNLPLIANGAAAILKVLTEFRNANDAAWTKAAGGTFPDTIPRDVPKEGDLTVWRSGFPNLPQASSVRVALGEWRIPSVAAANPTGRDILRDYAASKLPAFMTDIGRPYLDVLRDHDAMRRLAVDAAPYARAPIAVTVVIPEAYRSAAAALADRISPPVELTEPVTIVVEGDENETPLFAGDQLIPEFSGLLVNLQKYAPPLGNNPPGAASGPTNVPMGTAAAIAGLGALERDGYGKATFQLPWKVRQDPAVGKALADFDDLLRNKNKGGIKYPDPKLPKPSGLIIRRPLLASELKGIYDAAGADKDANAFAAFIAKLDAGGIFGAGRQPYLKVRRGLTDPHSTAIGRGTEWQP